MHLQQTKMGSRRTGGPQYYFHSLTQPVKLYLREKGVVRVALVTPYGATRTDFFAISKSRKFQGGEVVPGLVGHDRIQQGSASGSIGEEIRRWYGLRTGDFVKINVTIDILDDAFYLNPVRVYFREGRHVDLSIVERPLTFTKQYTSPLWREHLAKLNKNKPELLQWCIKEICRVASVHRLESKEASVLEPDLLRASGPLAHFGILLGPYRGVGYDCNATLTFLKYPPYQINFEFKKRSLGFKYQEQKYGKDELSRAVVLCALHNHRQLHRNIDVIELDAFSGYTP